MRIVSYVAALLCLSSASALACRPPPRNYFELGSIRAITESQSVYEKMGDQPVRAIFRVEHGKYMVESVACSLLVHVVAEQEDPKRPCGGPFTFTATPAGELTCRN